MKKEEGKNRKEWSTLDAIEVVLALSKGKKFEHDDECLDSALTYLSEKLKLTKIQVMLLAVLLNTDDCMSWSWIAKHFGCSLVKAMSYNSEMSDLVKARWVRRTYTSSNTCFQALPGVAEALSHDRVYTPRPLSGRTHQQLIDEIRNIFSRGSFVNMTKTECSKELVEANPDLPICKLAIQINDIHSYGIFFNAVENYLYFFDKESNAGIETQLTYYDYADLEYEEEQYIGSQLQNGTHELFDLGLLEHKFEDGMADPETLVLTDKVKEALRHYKVHKRKSSTSLPEGYVKHNKIKEKTLYYNDEDEKQIKSSYSSCSHQL